MTSCAHCLLPIAEGQGIRDEPDGCPVLFCCAGCRAVYRLLTGEGLGGFYRRRRGWAPGPPDPRPLEAEAFADSASPSPRGGCEATLAVSGTRCAACGWLIERYLGGRPGILDVRMNYATARLAIRWDPGRTGIAEIAGWILDLGYTPLPDDGAALEEAHERERRDLLLRFGTAAFLTTQIMMYTAALYAGYFQGIGPGVRAAFKAIAVLLAAPVLFYSGWPLLAGAVSGLRRRAPGMELLVALGASAAYAYSVAALATGDEIYVDTSAMIVTLVLLGRLLEARARATAASAVARLMRLLPRRARRLVRLETGAPCHVEAVPLAALRPGDEIEVAAGERIPVDGRVTEGISEADEAMLTGESRPVPKWAGSDVLAGTVNGNGRLAIRATRTGRDTVLSAIVRAVEEAQARKGPLQSAADRWAAAFVPSVVAVALLVLAYRIGAGFPFVPSLLIAISVLVVACPCALGLATPLAVFAGSLRAHEAGILVRGGPALESAARIDVVFLDKTGTLTEGRPRVTDVLPAGLPEARVLAIAASLEAPSEHPVGKALLRAAQEAGIVRSPVSGWTAHPGQGVSGRVDGVRYLLGRAPFLEAEGVPIDPAVRERSDTLAREGKTVVLLAGHGRLLGLLAAADTLRAGAAEAVRTLEAGGREVALLSGDHGEAARRIARSAGIRRVAAPVDPEAKARIVRAVRADGKRVLMAGDGVNDAPALAEADVGIAMGRGTDVAAASAGAILLRDDLRAIPAFLAISRRTLGVIRQNLAWAFSYNIVAIPLAASGRLHPVVAAAFMAGSSLLVVGNSLRLRRGGR